MLVYANNFLFQPANGPEEIVQEVARWVGTRAKQFVDSARVAEGIRELKLRDGSTLRSLVTLSDNQEKLYPYYFCAQLSHRDGQVSGRQWVTEVGLRQNAELQPIECSVLLRTEEISARVTSPIQVTRPKLVEELIDACNPLGQTPGLTVKHLTYDSARAFLAEIEREDRHFPIVVLSTRADGQYPVEPERLRSIVVGLADVVVVPASEDTFAIERITGRRNTAYGGAINIVFPVRNSERGRFCENVLMLPDDLAEALQSGLSVESEVLAAITHRTNLPNLWRHISLDRVAQARLRARLSQTIGQAKASEHSAELAEYVELLEAADHELRGKEEELTQLRSDYEEKTQEARMLQAKSDGLQQALSGQRLGYDGHDEAGEMLVPLREALAAVLNGNSNLQQAVDTVTTLYPDRIIFLDSAKASAKESDRAGFRQTPKALALLQKLTTSYWQLLADGKGDQQAKAVFGQNVYAANEASKLSNEGKRRRTFVYRGRELFMEKHLKHGVKDSPAETLRIHFEWLPDERKIVVGHCGKHLDF